MVIVLFFFFFFICQQRCGNGEVIFLMLSNFLDSSRIGRNNSSIKQRKSNLIRNIFLAGVVGFLQA